MILLNQDRSEGAVINSFFTDNRGQNTEVKSEGGRLCHPCSLWG